jgi:Spy/CpxP family protein refolding chaperone
MKRIKRNSILMGIGLLVVPFILIGCFKPGSSHFKKERLEQVINWHFSDLLDEIKADEEQTEKLTIIKDGIFEKMMVFHSEKRKMPKKILSELEKDNPDRDLIHQAVDQHIEQIKESAHNLADTLLEIHDILRPEQRQIIHTRIRDRHGCLSRK